MKAAVILLGSATLIAAGAPALAQPAPEEIIVEGRYGKVPDSVRSLSQARAMPTSTSAPRPAGTSWHRINLTARFLCDKLGESDTSTGGTPSCRDAANRDAMTRLGTIEQNFAPRGTTWVRPPAWTPPYPADWRTRYP